MRTAIAAGIAGISAFLLTVALGPYLTGLFLGGEEEADRSPPGRLVAPVDAIPPLQTIGGNYTEDVDREQTGAESQAGFEDTATGEQEQILPPADRCAAVTCLDTEAVCPDGFVARCSNGCQADTGECSTCTPDCTGHENRCADVICEAITHACPDGTEIACVPACDPATGQCGNCTPDCIGHEVCLEDWTCGNWSACSEGIETRMCTDQNRCGTEAEKPLETQPCATPVISVIFSEVMYDLNGSDSDREWIEVYNKGNVDVDLTAWRLQEGDLEGTQHLIESAQAGPAVSPGVYAVIADNPDQFLLDYPTYGGILFDSTFDLRNTNETLMLRESKDGQIIDALTYFNAWGGNGTGFTLEKGDLDGPNTQDNWGEGRMAGGTPGQENSRAQ